LCPAFFCRPGEVHARNAQPPERGIDNFLVNEFSQRRYAGYRAVGRVPLEGGFDFHVRRAYVGTRGPQAHVDCPMKTASVVETPLSARDNTGKRQKCIMARSFGWPVARKERSSRHPVNRGPKNFRIDVCRSAIEAPLEADLLAFLVDAWRAYCLQPDRSVFLQAAQFDDLAMIQWIDELYSAGRGVRPVEIVRGRCCLPAENEAGFREQPACGCYGFPAITIHIGASKFA
jgi:hypothetical protein